MRVRRVLADMNSAEVDQLRRGLNNLLRMMENARASITANASAEDVLKQWSDAINTGTDDNPNSIANVVSSSCPIEGCKPDVLHPKRLSYDVEDSSSTSGQDTF